MAICRSCGARETWVIEYYRHPAPLALWSDDADCNDPLFAQPSDNSPDSMEEESDIWPHHCPRP
jgi:hypothetical protein